MTSRRRKRAGLAASVAGTLAGVLGLTLIALPMDAGAAPTLPPVDAQQLVTSVLTAEPPAMAGTVTVQNDLGLPAIPAVGGGLLTRDLTARVWWDGRDHRARLALPSGGGVHGGSGSTVLVHDGQTTWLYNSAQRTVVKIAEPDAPDGRHRPSPAELTDEVAQLLGVIRETSTVRVDGTEQVAGRDAYELVLTPEPTERTLLRSVRVAVDAQTRVPLRLQIYANDQSEPALSVGFTELEVGPQPDRLFEFTPPEGVAVKTPAQAGHVVDVLPGGGFPNGATDVEIVGNGWDAVLIGRLPDSTNASAARGPLALAKRLGQPLSGPWGSGHVISTAVGTALVTEDGPFAIGAVPEQVLVEAIGNMR